MIEAFDMFLKSLITLVSLAIVAFILIAWPPPSPGEQSRYEHIGSATHEGM
jgi:hypothetical protein